MKNLAIRPFTRGQVYEIEKYFRSNQKPLIQVVIGPRQVGKTTAALKVAELLNWENHIASADSPVPQGPEWIESHWYQARVKANEKNVLLILDEIQKVEGWSEVVKHLWDEDRRKKINLGVLLLGSSALLLQHGLTESLAGRFFLHRFNHWSFSECHQAFGWSLDQWLYFGGYPGAAGFIEEESTWKRYIADSLIETVLARDVLQLQKITKPALLRQLFALAVSYPAQIISYNKMLGQLQDAGNTTTLAHYLYLLQTAFLISGLNRFSLGKVSTRASSPKLIVWNNGLINALSLHSFAATRSDSRIWGRIVENAVGAHILGCLEGPQWGVSYWRERDYEVDFVISHGKNIWCIEVKSGISADTGGVKKFIAQYKSAKPIMVGTDGIDLIEFFSRPVQSWLEVTRG